MSNFKIIETQEELDKVIGERLARQKETILDKFKDYDDLKSNEEKFKKEREDYQTKIKSLEESLEGLNKQLTENGSVVEALKKERDNSIINCSKVKAVYKYNLPESMIDRLRGETEEEIMEDANNISSLFKTQKKEPLAGEGSASGDNKKESLRGLLNDIREKE